MFPYNRDLKDFSEMDKIEERLRFHHGERIPVLNGLGKHCYHD